jgi:hypothetical protein
MQVALPSFRPCLSNGGEYYVVTSSSRYGKAVGKAGGVRLKVLRLLREAQKLGK